MSSGLSIIKKALDLVRTGRRLAREPLMRRNLQLRTGNATCPCCSCCTVVCYPHDSADRFESLRSPNQKQLVGW